jgi:hypothetical protein
MNTPAFWDALRAKFGAGTGPRTGRARTIALQHLVLSEREIDVVQTALLRVGEQLGVRFELQEHAGDIVLLDAQRAAQIAPQVVEAFTDGRPVVTLSQVPADIGLVATSQTTPSNRLQLIEQARAQHREAELLRQLREIPLVRRQASLRSARVRQAQSRSPALVGADSMQGDTTRGHTHSGVSTSFDTGFDSKLDVDQWVGAELDPAQLDFVQSLLQGLHNPAAAPISASYGEDAHLRFDFGQGRVTLNALAEQYLRVQSEVPRLSAVARTQAHATVRDLHQVVWDLGLACGVCLPLGAPKNWWYEPLTLRADARIDRYTLQPRHLTMALRLATGPATPSALRSQARVSVAELRRFLQACLMLGLVHWGSAPSNEETTS